MGQQASHLASPSLFLCFPSLLACDDECVGVLLDGLDGGTHAILSVNLSGVFPAPYGILSNLENQTKYFQVSTGNTEMDRHMYHSERESIRGGGKSQSDCAPTQSQGIPHVHTV
jgi:hypothetical protein